MPFTPFHMGFALVAKAAVSRYFSIPVFAFTQVIIDAEVLIGLALVGDLSNHAVLHNFAAAVLVALLAVLLRRPVIQPGARLWNHLARARTGSFLHMATRVSLPATVVSALFGGVSHVLLDATTHSDMAPFAPLNHPQSLLWPALPPADHPHQPASIRRGWRRDSGTLLPAPRTFHENFFEHRMTARDIAEALEDVEGLLGKLERIMPVRCVSRRQKVLSRTFRPTGLRNRLFVAQLP